MLSPIHPTPPPRDISLPQCQSILSSSNQGHPSTNSSSPYSDNEISSLYGKYRHSGHSLSEEDSHRHFLDHDSQSGQIASARTLDSNRTTQWPGVIDELNWMLGQAIDSAQSTFGDPSDTHERSPSVSHLSSYSQPSSRAQGGSSLEEPPNPSPPDESGKHSQEDMSELATSSSKSDYSDCVEEESREMAAQKSLQEPVTPQPTPGIAPSKSKNDHVDPPGDAKLITSLTLKGYPSDAVTGLTKYQVETLAQDFSMSALSTEDSVESLQLDGAQTVYSEEDTTSTSTNPSQFRLVRRSPSFKLNNFITRKYKDLVSLRKSEPTRDPPPPNEIDAQTPTPMTSAALPSQDSTPMNSPTINSPNKPTLDTPARKVIEEDSTKVAQSPSSAARSLMARSPVVKRTSSEINFFEQWQWLEAQHPSRKNSSSNQQNSLRSPHKSSTHADMKSTRVPNSRETCFRILNAHFASPDSAKDYFLKLALLSQRQQLYQQPYSRTNASKFVKVSKPINHSFQGVPSIDTKELKKTKTSKDRCRIYEAKLQQLLHHPTGLDLWVWLQTRDETRLASSVKQVKKLSIGSQVADPHPRPLRTQVDPKSGSNHPLISFRPSAEFSQHPYSNFPMIIRDASMSSIASFPLRDGLVPHKAVQIKQTGDKNLVEVPRLEGVGHRANRMAVNSLMEVNNLPYPSLYPHSTNQNRRIPSTPASTSEPIQTTSSFTRSIVTNNNSGLPKRSILELNSKSTGGGFFSQLTRQNSSSSRKNETPNNLNNSPSRSNISRISPALISAPIATPRGPRPDTGNLSKYPKNGQVTGDLTNPLLPQLNFHQAQQRLNLLGGSPSTSIPTHEVTQHQHEIEELKISSNPSSHSSQRMSFTYGTHHRQSAQRPAYHRHHNSTSWTSSIEYFNANDDSRLSLDEVTSKPIKRDDHFQVDLPQQAYHSTTLPDKIASSTQATLDLRQQVELKSKVQKLLDILPNADQNLLEKILIESNLNDIIAIGTYLELSQVKKPS